MAVDSQSINTLLLIDNTHQARKIGREIDNAYGSVKVNWVTSHAEFGAALRRNPVDLGVLYCEFTDQIVPAAILRHPDTPFLAVMDRYRNRTAEHLIDLGLSDVVGFSHPVRMARVLARMLSDATVRAENQRLVIRQKAQSTMLEALLHSTEDAVAYVHQGMHSYSNTAYQALLGATHPDDVLATPLLDIVHGDNRTTVVDQLRQFDNGQTAAARINTLLRHTEGHQIPVTLEFSHSWYDGEPVIQLVARERSMGMLLDDHAFSANLADQTLKLADFDLTERLH